MDPIGEPTRDRGEKQARERHRRHQQGSPGRAEATHDLRPDHERDRHGRNGETHRRDRQVGDGEVAVAEEPEGHQRLAPVSRLPGDEEGEHEKPDHDHRPDHGIPVVLVALLDAEDEEKHSHCGQGDAQPVEGVRVRVDAGHQPGGQDEGDDPHGDIDEEDPWPARSIDEEAAEDRADEGRHPGRRAPDGHGRSAARSGEDARDDGHRLRRHHRSAQTLHHAGDPKPNAKGATFGRYNEGIPIHLIRDMLAKRNLLSYLG